MARNIRADGRRALCGVAVRAPAGAGVVRADVHARRAPAEGALPGVLFLRNGLP